MAYSPPEARSSPAHHRRSRRAEPPSLVVTFRSRSASLLIWLHPHAQRGHHRPVRARRCRHTSRRDAVMGAPRMGEADASGAGRMSAAANSKAHEALCCCCCGCGHVGNATALSKRSVKSPALGRSGTSCRTLQKGEGRSPGVRYPANQDRPSLGGPRQRKEAPHKRRLHSGTGYDPSARFLRLGCPLAFQASSSSARAHNVRPLMNPSRPLSRFALSDNQEPCPSQSMIIKKEGAHGLASRRCRASGYRPQAAGAR